MEFRLLGALEVEDGGRLLRFEGRKERVLLALLLLHENEVVSRERLVEGLWRGEPPASAVHSVEAYVSRLRKLLGGAGLIESYPEGYRLQVGIEQSDRGRFERLVREGWQALTAGEASAADVRLGEALSLWRGRPFPELAGEPEAELEAERLEELRISAVEGQLDAQLALAHHVELVGRLRALVAAYPLREGLQRRLMLALYRCGRQAEALEVYQQARRRLLEELGIEPGRGLQELQQAILRQDVELDAPASAQPPAAAAERPSAAVAVAGLALGPSELGLRRKERKVVTTLFADLVGFTARSERLDPEDVAAELARYQAGVRAELERFGGTVQKSIGDSVAAFFGAPVAHEDDPERAVRAALAICEFADEEGVQLRVGVSTGEALVTVGARPEAGETLAAGDVVTVAARLRAAAPVNGVLVGEQTFRATEAAIEYERAGPMAVNGKAEPVAVWRPLRARARARVERVRGAALVGRRRELELLREALVRVREERSPQLVTLVGVPGIGKSRLVLELFEQIEREPGLTSWRRGRCLPYGDGVTFWALGEMVKAQAGILESDHTAAVETKLHAVVGDPWVESHLRPLVGLAGGAARGGDRREEAFVAWRRFFEGLAERRPLVLVFEDLHWADEELLDFVDYLVDWATRVPLLVVCVARPELLARRPGWGGGKPNALTISLPPLADDEMAQLLGELLEPSLLAAAQTELLARAGGNPLYAEEYARMLRERGGLQELPETVQGLIAARVDLLEPAQKALLADAAVVGETFWAGALAALGDQHGIEEKLHALERGEFVRRERDPSLEDELEYAFSHVLIRDVAYGQIPRAERLEKHRRAAAWIESLGRRHDHAEMLAHHYLQALELAAAAGIDTAPFAASAGAALADAGGRAFALNAFAAAARYYRAALELLPDRDPGRGMLLLRLGRTLYLGGEPDAAVLEAARDELTAVGDAEAVADAEAELAELYSFWGERDVSFAHLGRARTLVEPLPPSPVKAHTIASATRLMALAGESDDAIRLGREALTMAERLGLDDVRARALNYVGLARLDLGDRGGRSDLEAAIEIADRSRSIYELCRAKWNLAGHLWGLGELATARRLAREAAEAADRFGQAGFARLISAPESTMGYTMGDWDDALQRANTALAGVEAGNPGYYATDCYVTRALIRLARGQTDAAVADAKKAIAAGRPAFASTLLYEALAAGAHIFLGAGDPERAEAAAGELLNALQTGPPTRGAHEDACPLAWTLTALGRGAELAAALDRFDNPWAHAGAAFARGNPVASADICADIGARTYEAYARLAAARKGEPGQLERALTFYRSVRATRYVREGEALLAVTA